jgi:heat shock protein HtpX
MRPAGLDLFSQQEINRRKSSWLLIGFIVFFAWVGFGGDIALYMMRDNGLTGGYQHTIPYLGIIATTIAAVTAWSAWKYGDRQVLWSTRAMELINPATAEQKRLMNIADEMSLASGLPRPRIWVIPDDDLNAFATGPDPEHASVAVTEGLIANLDRDELQAVVAHEFAHVARYDTRLMTLVAAMVGSIALISDGMGRFLFHGGRVGRRGGRRIGKAGGAGMVVLVAWLVTLLVAPIVSRLIAMSISRKREFLADATAAQFTRNPDALVSALEKLDNSRTPTRAVGRGASHLCIVDPSDRRFQRWKGVAGDLFASHPPIEARTKRLRQMGAITASESISG